ncbi:MAG TPA: DNA (cytosine-5-)-methyltransferase [Candidatus Paceibacterota bacterium]|nr:DNA (cytosine-5-)-methyltransferase [Candidatus Paceibacterota bacterium]
MKSGGDKIRVVELFAGVGGFRLGLEGSKGNRKPHHSHFETVWFNQWEPSTKRQHAHETYARNFGHIDEYTNEDIAKVTGQVPDHDLLVGGFPCQDYSVARNLSSSAGLEGKKGVLWWSIHEILNIKGSKAPNYLMLENVDRLLVSPASRRGKDFAIILSSLIKLGYVIEWRVINAAEYGFPQRRKRTFILGYKKGSPIEKRFRKLNDPEKWLIKDGVVQQSFPAVLDGDIRTFTIDSDPVIVSKEFNLEKPQTSPFANTGVMVDGRVYTARVTPNYKGKYATLGDVLLPESEVPKEYYIDKEDLPRWVYLKGAKNEPRKGSDGFEFTYKEGAMSFPDSPTKASRTIITAEGGKTPSRFKHVVKTKKGYRRLTPIELERLCMFPDNHTQGHPDARRAFFMGNALVVGVIDGLGKALVKLHTSKI